MSNQTSILRSTDEDSKYVRNKLIEFNANQLSDDIKNNYEEINLHIKDMEENIVGDFLACFTGVGLRLIFCGLIRNIGRMGMDQVY